MKRPGTAGDLAVSAERLRLEFDYRFSRPADIERPASTRLLLLTLGETEAAIAVDHLASLHEVDTVVPLPTSLDELLGLVSLGGRVYPCFSLASLLDLEAGEPRWLLVLQRAPVVLAVDGLAGQFLVETDTIRADAAGHGSPFIGRVRHGENDLKILDADAILDRLRQLTGEGGE